MARYKDWFSVDVGKRAARVRGFPLAHVIKELLANSLDAGATNISLSCHPAERTRVDRANSRAYLVQCRDDGAGCADPEVLRRVGSTTSDQSATKRGRFGQGLIDVLTICEDAEITSLKHRLTFREGECVISSLRTSIDGLSFVGTVRHPAASIAGLVEFFDAVILPDGVTFSFNDKIVQSRKPVRVVTGVKLPAPLYDHESQLVRQRTLATELHLFEQRGAAPMVYEMGVPVDEMPWSLPFDVNVMQKVPLDVDRIMLPTKFKERIVSELIGPCSDLYALATAEEGTAPPEIRNDAANARRLAPEAQRAVLAGHLKADPDKLVRRNPLDKDDRSESQELEVHGYVPISRGHLPAGISTLVADVPTVAQTHDEVCKVRVRVDRDFPPETKRQTDCLSVFSQIASALLRFEVRCDLIQGGAKAVWGNRTISFNIDYAPIWAEPLGDETLRILLHECAHAKVTGHNEDWGNEAARLGGVLARWVGENHDLWKELHDRLSRDRLNE